MLKDDKERELWSKLDHNYMTDQSEHEDDNGDIVIHQHELPWRSHGLNDAFVSEVKTSSRPKVAMGPSSLLPPADHPMWAVAIELVVSWLFFIVIFFCFQHFCKCRH